MTHRDDDIRTAFGDKTPVMISRNLLAQAIADFRTSEALEKQTIPVRATLEALLAAAPKAAEQAGQEPVARVQSYVSDRPYSKGERVKEAVFLSDVRDDTLLYAAPIPRASDAAAQPDKTFALLLMGAAAKSGDSNAIALAAQLAGAAPCEACGFVNWHCRCKQKTAPPDERAAFVKAVQSLAFLCRTDSKRLDDETLAALDNVENHLVAMGASTRDSDGDLRATAPQAAAPDQLYTGGQPIPGATCVVRPGDLCERAAGLIEQHHRDSAELRSLCFARDAARQSAEFWKAEHLAGNREIERLRAELDAAKAGADAMSDAARDVLAERARQVSVEGWTHEHDDEHREYALACAAGCYAMFTLAFPAGDPPPQWPWDVAWWKPTTQRRNLIKAGALILAEIERIDRAGGMA